AAPLLLIVLLLVFRSLIAALIPLAFGALTVLAGRGVLVFLSSLMSIDALSLVVCTMMGLALGVDYSLLIVSRFREELANELSRGSSGEARTDLGADAGREGRGVDVAVHDPTRATEDKAQDRVRVRQAAALAAQRTRASAGRTTAIAGATLFFSIFFSA